jgi:Carboxypeptidase regulatory-like domain/Bacterial Ig-like domain (group 3)
MTSPNRGVTSGRALAESRILSLMILSLLAISPLFTVASLQVSGASSPTAAAVAPPVAAVPLVRSAGTPAATSIVGLGAPLAESLSSGPNSNTPPPPGTTGAYIWTDQNDYPPESNVTIYGINFLPVADVNVTITNPDSSIASWLTLTNSSGEFTTMYKLDSLGGLYYVNATEGTNHATTTFTDTVTIDFSTVNPSDSVGTTKSSFFTTDDVYATIVTTSNGGGSGVNPADGFAYVISGSCPTINNTPLTDVSGGYETVSYSTTGTFVEKVWPAPTSAGIYAIVIDANKNNLWDTKEPCATFTVTAPSLTATFDAPVIRTGGDVSGSTAVLTVTVGGSGATCTGGSATTVTKSMLGSSGYTTSAVSSGTDVCFSYSSPVASTAAGKQYRWGSISSATGSATGQSGQSGSFTITTNSAVTASYVTQWQVTFAVAPPAGGSTTPSGTAFYDAGSLAILATPSTNWVFSSWSSNTGSITFTSSTSASTSATISGTGTITANFEVTTSTTISCASPAIVGSPDSCTLTVSNVDTTYHTAPTGTAAFSSAPAGFPASELLSSGDCTPTMTSVSCTFSFTPSAGSEGTYSALKASYGGDTTHQASSGTTSLDVTTGTSTTIACPSTSILYTGTNDCTVTVQSDDSSDDLAPTGTVTVTFTQTNGNLDSYSQTCTLSGASGTSTCTTTFTADGGDEGTWTAAASYPGDGFHGLSATIHSASFEVTTGTTVSLSCSPTSIDWNGDTETCVATVTSADSGDDVSITGTLTVANLPSDASQTTCILSGPAATATCKITYAASSGDEGTYTVTASYGGDTYHAVSGPSSSQTFTVKTDTTTTFTCTFDYISYTGSTTCTVTVTNADTGYPTPPSGTISITATGPSDFPALCSPLSGSGDSSTCTFTYDAASGDEGVWSIYSTFASGDTTHIDSDSSGSPFALTIYTTSTTALTCPSPVSITTAGSTEDCTVTVTPEDSGAPSITGDKVTIAITLHSTPGTLSLSSSSCNLGSKVSGAYSCDVNFNLPSGSEGSYTLTATYPTDSTAQVLGSSGTANLVIVTGTSIGISCSPSSIDWSAGVESCVATVTSADSGDSQSITGTVTASSDFPDASSCTLTGPAASAHCTFTFTADSGDEGSYSVTASYGGDAYHGTSGPSNSQSFKVTTGTSTSFTTCPTPATVGVAESCTVTVTSTDTNDDTMPSGTIAFTGYPTGFPSGCTLSSTMDGVASCTFSWTPSLGSEGTYTVTATYSSDSYHAGSSGQVAIVVQQRSTSTLVDCTPSTILVGGQSTCTATVTDTSGGTPVTPTGTVVFTSGTGTFSIAAGYAFTSPGTCTLVPVSLGVAKCAVTYTASSAGTLTVTGTYSGDADHFSSYGSFALNVYAFAVTTCVADGNFNCNDTMEAVFTSCTSATCHLTATNPGDEFYVYQFTNNQGTSVTPTLNVVIPWDSAFNACAFTLKGAQPVRVNGGPGIYQLGACTSTGQTLTVTLGTVGAGQTVLVEVHLDYNLKYGYTGAGCATGAPTYCTENTFNRGYTFKSSLSLSGPITVPTSDANVGVVGKKATALGGFIMDSNGDPKTMLTVVVTDSHGSPISCYNNVGALIPACVETTDMSGWYFFTFANSGTYIVNVYNSVNQLKAGPTTIKLSNNQFMEADFKNLAPSDPIVQGRVTSSTGMPMGGVTVQLIAHNGKVFATTMTDADGYYVFRFSQPGTYKVEIILPSGYSSPQTSFTLSLTQFQTATVDFELTKAS